MNEEKRIFKTLDEIIFKAKVKDNLPGVDEVVLIFYNPTKTILNCPLPDLVDTPNTCYTK